MKKNKLTKYEAMEILAKKYPDSRCQMSKKRETKFVADLYELYERVGFSDVYTGDKDDKYNGLPFKVLSRIPAYDGKNDGYHLSSLPMWLIQFENGDKTEAFPFNISDVTLERDFDSRFPDKNDKLEQHWLSEKLARLLAENPGLLVTPLVKRTNRIVYLYGEGSYRLRDVYLGKYFRPCNEDSIISKIDPSDRTPEAMRERRSTLIGCLAYFRALDDVEKMSDKKVFEMYERLPWKKTIFVEVDTYKYLGDCPPGQFF